MPSKQVLLLIEFGFHYRHYASVLLTFNLHFIICIYHGHCLGSIYIYYDFVFIFSINFVDASLRLQTLVTTCCRVCCSVSAPLYAALTAATQTNRVLTHFLRALHQLRIETRTEQLRRNWTFC